MKEIREELGLEEKDCDWKYALTEFSNMSKISDYDSVYEKFKNLDIGVMIINAGSAQFYPFIPMPKSDILN